MEWWMPEVGGVNEKLEFNGEGASVLRDYESSGDGWWQWLHSHMNALTTTEHV